MWQWPPEGCPVRFCVCLLYLSMLSSGLPSPAFVGCLPSLLFWMLCGTQKDLSVKQCLGSENIACALWNVVWSLVRFEYLLRKTILGQKGVGSEGSVTRPEWREPGAVMVEPMPCYQTLLSNRKGMCAKFTYLLIKKAS